MDLAERIILVTVARMAARAEATGADDAATCYRAALAALRRRKVREIVRIVR